MRTSLINWWSRFAKTLLTAGPYLAFALVPGGTLILLSLLALRHRVWIEAHARGLLSVGLILCAAILVSGAIGPSAGAQAVTDFDQPR
jgi:hypothetical protein